MNASDRLQKASETLGLALRERRRTLGLSQQQLADLAGCSRLFVGQLERGRPTARLDAVLTVLTALGLEFLIKPGNRGIVG